MEKSYICIYNTVRMTSCKTLLTVYEFEKFTICNFRRKLKNPHTDMAMVSFCFYLLCVTKEWIPYLVPSGYKLVHIFTNVTEICDHNVLCAHPVLASPLKEFICQPKYFMFPCASSCIYMYEISIRHFIFSISYWYNGNQSLLALCLLLSTSRSTSVTLTRSKYKSLILTPSVCASEFISPKFTILFHSL